MVKIVFPAIIAKVTNDEREVIVTASTIKEALTQLVTRYGESFEAIIFDSSGKPKRSLNFFLNGRNIRFINDLNTPLKNTDVVTILPSASGG